MLTIEGRNLSCVRGMRTIFRELDFTVKNGECLILSGENGSGKTSLLRIIAGYIKPSNGVLVSNESDIHYIGTSSSLRNSLTIKENLDFWSDMMGGDNTHVSKAIKTLGLEKIENNQVGTLSSGQVKRCSLARLLLVKRKIWLLDEPETALDKNFLGQFINIINSHTKSNGIAIIASHRQELWSDNNILELG